MLPGQLAAWGQDILSVQREGEVEDTEAVKLMCWCSIGRLLTG